MMSYEAAFRHAEVFVDELGFTKGKLLSTLSVKDDHTLEEYMGTALLEPADTTRYKPLVVRASVMIADMQAIQYGCKEFSPSTANPRTHDSGKLARLGKSVEGQAKIRAQVLEDQQHQRRNSPHRCKLGRRREAQEEHLRRVRRHRSTLDKVLE